MAYAWGDPMGDHSKPDEPDELEVLTMFTRAFLLGLADRAIKSSAQALLLMWGAGQLNVLTVDWRAVVGFGGGALLLSVLTSLVSGVVGDRGTSSLLPGGH